MRKTPKVRTQLVKRNHELFRNEEILKGLRMMNRDKTPGCARVVMELIMANEKLDVEWLNSG